jgi:hypothetical protein
VGSGSGVTVAGALEAVLLQEIAKKTTPAVNKKNNTRLLFT